VLKNSLATPEFEQSLHKCCVEVGLCLEPGSSTYKLYSETKKGFMSAIIRPVVESDEHVAVADIAAELALEARPSDKEADNSDSEEGGEEGGEESEADAE